MDDTARFFKALADEGSLEVAKEHLAVEALLVGHLRGAAQRLEAAGFPSQPQVLYGSTRGLLVRHAEERGADLVVLGGDAHGFMRCGLRGCTACWVVKHAPCSVLIIRDRRPAP
jgi:nucleotide-binding universal stress UspA family protein